MQFVFRVIANGIALWIASELISGFNLHTDGTWQNAVIVVGVIAAILTVIHSIVRPIVKVLTFPLYILTLGLFFVVVNALMLMLAGWASGFLDYGLDINNFGTAVIASLLISLVAAIVIAILPRRNRSRSRQQ